MGNIPLVDNHDEVLSLESRLTARMLQNLAGRIVELESVLIGTFVADYDASSGVFPTSGSGPVGTILRGDYWYISVAGIIGTIELRVGDALYSKRDNPGIIQSYWFPDRGAIQTMLTKHNLLSASHEDSIAGTPTPGALIIGSGGSENIASYFYSASEITSKNTYSTDFLSLNQGFLSWSAMAADPNGDIYACASGGDIYKQTGGVGDFIALGQAIISWSSITIAPNGDAYACPSSGDIYKRTGRVGDFVPIGGPNRNWYSVSASVSGDIYACAADQKIYKQTGGVGDFVDTGEVNRNWQDIAYDLNGDVYACVINDDIYKQTGGTGNFVAQGQTSRIWNGLTITPDGDVYAAAGNGDIYKQTNRTGNFVAQGQASRNWYAMAAAPNGNVYACSASADIYMKNNSANASFLINTYLGSDALWNVNGVDWNFTFHIDGVDYVRKFNWDNSGISETPLSDGLFTTDSLSIATSGSETTEIQFSNVDADGNDLATLFSSFLPGRDTISAASLTSNIINSMSVFRDNSIWEVNNTAIFYEVAWYGIDSAWSIYGVLTFIFNIDGVDNIKRYRWGTSTIGGVTINSGYFNTNSPNSKDSGHFQFALIDYDGNDLTTMFESMIAGRDSFYCTTSSYIEESIESKWTKLLYPVNPLGKFIVGKSGGIGWSDESIWDLLSSINFSNLVIGSTSKKTGEDAGTLRELSFTDDYGYICVQAGTTSTAIWKKFPLIQT